MTYFINLIRLNISLKKERKQFWADKGEMLVEEDNNPIRCKRIWTKLWAISSDIVPSNMATFGGFVGPLLFFFSFFFLLSLHFIPPTLGDLFQIKYIFFIEKTNYVIICFFFFIFENYICFTKFLNYDFQIF